MEKEQLRNLQSLSLPPSLPTGDRPFPVHYLKPSEVLKCLSCKILALLQLGRRGGGEDNQSLSAGKRRNRPYALDFQGRRLQLVNRARQQF